MTSRVFAIRGRGAFYGESCGAVVAFFMERVFWGDFALTMIGFSWIVGRTLRGTLEC